MIDRATLEEVAATIATVERSRSLLTTLLGDLQQERARLAIGALFTPREALELLRANCLKRVEAREPVEYYNKDGDRITVRPTNEQEGAWKRHHHGYNSYEGRVYADTILDEVREARAFSVNVP